VIDLFLVDILKQGKIFYSTSSMSYGIKCVTICACDWLLFVFYYIYIVYDIMYVFNYLNIMRYIQVALSRQHYLLSSCTQQTLLRKLQGIADGHIPLPKRQYQQVSYWQTVDRQNHPIIKRTCSKIRYYYSPWHVTWNSKSDETDGLKCNKKSQGNQTKFVFLICGSFWIQLKCFYSMALIKWYVRL
jgi:hypothetical protein